MPSSRAHTLHERHGHFGWNNAFPPALTVAPGESVEFHTIDASGGQLGPKSTVADVAALDFGKVNPVTGPVRIDGAAPGDAVKVTVLSHVKGPKVISFKYRPKKRIRVKGGHRTR